MLFFHGLDLAFRGRQEAAASDVQYLSDWISDCIGCDAELREDEDESHYKWEDPACDRACEKTDDSRFVCQVSAESGVVFAEWKYAFVLFF